MNARLAFRAGLVIGFVLFTQTACKSSSDSARMDGAGPEPASEKIMKDRVVILNVMSETQLLAILETIGRVEGVREVRRIDFDRRTNEALLEIEGERRRQTHWRATLENLPKMITTAPDAARKELPVWFTKPSTN
jgi:hypothetical protein